MSYWTHISGIIKTYDDRAENIANYIQSQLNMYCREFGGNYIKLNDNFIFDFGLRSCEDDELEKLIEIITRKFDDEKDCTYEIFAFTITNRDRVYSRIS